MKIIISSCLLLIALSVSPGIYAQQSRLVSINIPAPALENIIFGIPNTQTLAVYLPPSYDMANFRYPVVYFLTGYGDRIDDWTNGTYQGFKIKNVMDNLILNQTIKEFIVVIVSGYNFMGGSFYVNSSVTGNWKDFITQDVVGYVDGNYRTLKNPVSRGISGHSMGGFGALNIAMHHPEIFGFVYSLSPGLFDTTGLSECQLFKSEGFINQFIQKEREYSVLPFNDALTALKTYIAGRFSSGDWDTPFAYAYGTAFSPNSNLQMPCINYPYSESAGQLKIDSIKLRNYENGFGGLAQKVNFFKNNLLMLRGITIDFGVNDEYRWILKGCRYFSDLLTAEGIQHQKVTFNGGHQDQVAQRIRGYLLPFFSAYLEFDTTLTEIKKNYAQPKHFHLNQNYPNPFNPSTNISFSIDSKAHVTLKIFDLLGKEVTTIVSKEMPFGSYICRWNAQNYPGGIYFYRLSAMPSAGRYMVSADDRDKQAGLFTDAKKFVVLKQAGL